MSYIYKITNNINQKVYIGKTERSVEVRWREHLKEYNTDNLNRPLYNAMKKYGKEHFSIFLIEECDSSISSEREQYWISVFNSYYKGYNATLGGEGRFSVNSDLIFELFNQGKSATEICKITGHSLVTVSNIIKSIEENIEIFNQRWHAATSKPVVMLDKDTGEEIRVFNSAHEAMKYCNKNGHGHISAVCLGKKKNCFWL